MRVTKAEVENFRILENVAVDFDEKVTLVVGRNNSGKTSLTEIFFKFLGGESSQFRFEDFSMASCKRFKESYEKFLEYQSAKTENADEDDIAAKEAAFKELLPKIELRLYIQYEEADDLASLSKLIMDLDEDRKDALLVCRYSIARPELFFREYEKVKSKYDEDVVKFVRKNYSKFYSDVLMAVDAEDPTNSCVVTKKDVANVFLTGFIYAQNQLDDLSVDKTKGLSKGFEDYYRLNSDDNSQVESIKQALAEISKDLDKRYIDLFSSIFEDLKSFGIGTGANLQELKIVSLFEAEKIIKGNTQLFYSQGEKDDLLPEAHNGLGYTKLIFTILRFISFYEEFAKRDVKPSFQIIFVEEPEAHLHPQMQYVFIKNIKDFVAKKDGWNVQIVVTTHSSHIVSESGFDCIRYFDNSVKPLQVKNLSDFKKKQNKADPNSINFLEQYMTLHKCDMFFADKVILIEGTVERLLLPEMIKQVSSDLLHQYISIIEVGGAYALNFKRLLEFLNVQTLIITDIDSVEPTGHHAACKVEQASAITSNATLKKWLPQKEAISDLLAVTLDGKAADRIRVTYQIPEEGETQTGRSFEQAFILRNAATLGTNIDSLSVGAIFQSNGQSRSEQEIKDESYNIAAKIDKKTDFAFDIITLPGWQTPKYIAEGLEWLGGANDARDRS